VGASSMSMARSTLPTISGSGELFGVAAKGQDVSRGDATQGVDGGAAELSVAPMIAGAENYRLTSMRFMTIGFAEKRGSSDAVSQADGPKRPGLNRAASVLPS